MAERLLKDLLKGSTVLAGKAYDADGIREPIEDRDGYACIPAKSTRVEEIPCSKRLYRKRNLIERFFNKIKQFRRIAPASTASPQTTSP